jgi:hypothetical protein
MVFWFEHFFSKSRGVSRKSGTKSRQAKSVSMFNSVALDVVIGLIFIYLLYSLLATVLSEIIATKLGLRARNLKEAVDRMLNDEDDNLHNSKWERIKDSLRLMKNPKNPIIEKFYNNPEIKYLGSSGLFRNPSSFKAVSFSKTLLFMLVGDKPVTREEVDRKLKEIMEKATTNEKIMDPHTAEYINSLWKDSSGDVVRFKLQLEAWFDRTMEQATEWYKRKIQIVLLVLGFLMAWFFNADTFVIVRKLSNDKDARDKMVSMANAYIQNNRILEDTAKYRHLKGKDSLEFKMYSQKLDSLYKIKDRLEADIASANSLLGLGGWLPDSVKVTVVRGTGEKVYSPQIDASLIRPEKNIDRTGCTLWERLCYVHADEDKGKLRFGFWEKIDYLFLLLFRHFLGFLLTAIAISLGAPFWFDLLNKLMKLRTSVKQETETSNITADKIQTQPVTVSINQSGEEAVG